MTEAMTTVLLIVWSCVQLFHSFLFLLLKCPILPIKHNFQNLVITSSRNLCSLFRITFINCHFVSDLVFIIYNGHSQIYLLWLQCAWCLRGCQCDFIYAALTSAQYYNAGPWYAIIHCVSEKTTLMLHTIDSTHINRFRQFLAEMLLREYAIEWWFIIPPLLTNVSALPRETWTRK